MKKMISKWISVIIIMAMIFTMIPPSTIMAEEIDDDMVEVTEMTEATGDEVIEPEVITEEILAEDEIAEEAIAEDVTEEAIAEDMVEEAVAEDEIEISEETEITEDLVGDSSNPKILELGKEVTLENRSGTYYMKYVAVENMFVKLEVEDDVAFHLQITYPDGSSEGDDSFYSMDASLVEKHRAGFYGIKLKKGQTLKANISAYNSKKLNSSILLDYRYSDLMYMYDVHEDGNDLWIDYMCYPTDAYIEVYRRKSLSDPWKFLGESKAGDEEIEIYIDKTTKPDQVYYYTARKYDETLYNQEGLKYYMSAMDQTGKPGLRMSRPKVTATNDKSGVKITWTEVPGVEYYSIVRTYPSDWVAPVHEDDEGYYPEKKIADVVAGSDLVAIDSKATSGKEAIYYVYLYRNCGGTSFSTSVMCKNTYLSSITPKLGNGGTGMLVKWDAVKGASKYRVYRKSGTGSFALIATTTSTSYTDKAVASKNGTTYTYAVKAIKGSYTSSIISKSLCRLTKVTLYGYSRTKAVYLKWTKNDKATGYKIEYSTSSSFAGSKSVVVKGAASLSKTIGSLTKGKYYYVRIRPYKTISGVNHWGAWSNTVRVKAN